MTVERESVGATHYEVLGVPRDADRQAIARAYRAAMRRLHPDAAEAMATDSVDEIAAVQEAWRVLQDADARTAYDRELSAPVDVWSDLGWGVAVDAPDVDGSETAPSPEPPDADPQDERDAGDQVDPWRTPFAAGAVHIPPPAPPAGKPRRGMLDWVLTSAVVVLAVATAVMWSAWRDEVPPSAVWLTVPAGGLMLCGALLMPVVLFAMARSAPRDSSERAACFGLGGVMTVVGAGSLVGAGLHPVLLGCAEAGAVLAATLAVRRRISTVRRAAADERARMTAYHRSAEWNRIREALRARGSRVEESRGAPNTDEPWRIRVVDPMTREERRRDVPGGLPSGAWVVVDKRGRALATAPPGALEAWLACWGRSRANL